MANSIDPTQEQADLALLRSSLNWVYSEAVWSGSTLLANLSVCKLDHYSQSHTCCLKYVWAATWQNQQNEFAASEDSDQLGHPPSLIRVFAACSMGSWGPKGSSCGQRRLSSDMADAQADLSLCWMHNHFVGFVMLWLIYSYSIRLPLKGFRSCITKAK